MRRFKQLLDREYTDTILYKITNGVLAVNGDEGYPYAVPVSYAYDGKAIYFHSAKTGHKIEAIMRNPKVSFCVVGEDNIIPEKFTTYFRSVIAFGQAEILSDEAEIMYGLKLLSEKYSPGIDPTQEITGGINRLNVIRINIESITGKEAIEFVRRREQSNYH